MEKKTTTVLDAAGKAWQVHGETIVRVVDKSRSSIDRMVKSMEQQSAVYGKSGVDKLMAQQAQLLAQWEKSPRAIDAITKSFAERIRVEKEAAEAARISSAAAETSGPAWQKLGLGIKDVFEGRMAYGQVEGGKFIASLGGMAMGAGIAAGAVLALGFAAEKSFTSLGELGLEMENVHLKTGLAVNEVEKFTFAAKMAGSDASVYERIMRGLSQASEENSMAGEKARKTLASMGVDLRDKLTGELRSTSEVLMDLSVALNKMPVGMERDAAAIDLFKRAGIDAIPVMVGLAGAVQKFQADGFAAPTDADIKKWKDYRDLLTETGERWEHFKRGFMEPLAATWNVILKIGGKIVDSFDKFFNVDVPMGASPAAGDEWGDEDGDRAQKIAARQKADAYIKQFYGNKNLEDQLRDAEKVRSGLGEGPQAGITPLADAQAYKAADDKVKGLKAQIEAVKKAGEEEKHQVTELAQWRHAAAELNRRDDEAELSAIGKIYYATDQLIKQGFATKGTTASELIAVQQGGDAHVAFELNKANDALTAKSMSEGETGLSHVNLLDRGMKGEGWMASSIAQDNADRETRDAQAKKDEESRQRIYSTQYDSQKDSLNRTAGNALKISQASGATGMDAIRDSYQIRIDLAKQLAVIAADRISKESDHDKQQELFANAQKDLQKEMSEAAEESLLKQLELQKQQLEVLKKDTEGLWNTLLTKPGQFGKQLASTVHAAVIKPITEGMATVTSRVLKPVIYGADGDGGIAGTMKGLFGGGKQDPMKVATDMNTAVTAQNSAALSMLTAILAGAMGMSAPAMAAAPAGMGGVSAPAISISAPSVAAPLLSNAFRAPSPGGGGFGGGGGLGGFMPMLFGNGGGGSAPTSIQSSGGGFFPSQSFSGGRTSSWGSPDVTGGSSGGSAGLFNLPTSSHTSNLPLMAALFGGGGGSQSGGSQSGGAVSPMLAALGMGGGKGAASPMAAMLGMAGASGKSGAGSMAGNFSGMLKGFKGNLGGFTRSDGSYTTDSDTGEISDVSGGKINGVNGLAGAALMGGGMMAAQAGLLGKNRGTWGGIAEGAAGGAAVGMSIAGPIGAGIGAVAGFGIGLGEMLAGDVSPETKAKQLCKQIYGISIDSGMATQIAQLAQSKYGGNVAIAVRDPDTRKMLQLYATGTGQKFPLSATTPQAGSLQEQGGKLYQVATYQNGNPYTFQSSLPVAGGFATGQYPSPPQGGSGPTNVTLSLNGQSAADVLEGRIGSTVTPGFVQDQYASAQSSSNGRVDNSAMMQQPGLITS